MSLLTLCHYYHYVTTTTMSFFHYVTTTTMSFLPLYHYYYCITTTMSLLLYHYYNYSSVLLLLLLLLLFRYYSSLLLCYYYYYVTTTHDYYFTTTMSLLPLFHFYYYIPTTTHQYYYYYFNTTGSILGSTLLLCHHYYYVTTTTISLLPLCHYYHYVTSTTMSLLLLCHFYHYVTTTTTVSPLLLCHYCCATTTTMSLLLLCHHYYYVTLIIDPRVGEAWLATHLGEGNSHFKPLAREPCCGCVKIVTSAMMLGIVVESALCSNTMSHLPLCHHYYYVTLIIDPRVGEAWLATHLGEGNSHFKPLARGPFCGCVKIVTSANVLRIVVESALCSNTFASTHSECVLFLLGENITGLSAMTRVGTDTQRVMFTIHWHEKKCIEGQHAMIAQHLYGIR